MDQENKMSEEQAASALTEVYQKFDHQHADTTAGAEGQSGTDGPAENSDTDGPADQFKGSDADADRETGGDDLPDPEDAEEQMKGSDADIDRPA